MREGMKIEAVKRLLSSRREIKRSLFLPYETDALRALLSAGMHILMKT